MHGAPVVHGASGHGATTDGKAPADRDGASQRSMLGHVAKEPAVDEIEVAVARIAQPGRRPHDGVEDRIGVGFLSRRGTLHGNPPMSREDMDEGE